MAFLPSLTAHQSDLGDMGGMNSLHYQEEISHRLIPSQGYNSLEMEPLAYLPYEPPRRVLMINFLHSMYTSILTFLTLPLAHPVIQEDLIPGHSMDQKIDVTNKLQCTTCGKQYSRKQSLDKHVQCHLPEKQWQCEYHGCGQKFKLKEYLKSHQKVHKKTLIGENMGAASVAVELDSFGDAVQHHAVGGQGQGEDYSIYSTFHCSICGKVASTQEALRDHELTHKPG